MKKFICAVVSSLLIYSVSAQRTTLSLDGTWDIDESVRPNDMPRNYSRTVQVPGLAHNSTPAFEDVDKFESREYLNVNYWLNNIPRESWLDSLKTGISKQKRNYFWYHTSFNPGNRRDIAMLKLKKAQFGICVWLNGRKVGEHMGCFNSVTLDLSKQIIWQGNNDLVIRVGAHPGVMDMKYPTGTDCEKSIWTPGIYDNASVVVCDNPYIEYLQIVPHISSNSITVDMKIRNFSNQKKIITLSNTIKPWKSNEISARGLPQTMLLSPGETKTYVEEIKIQDARLWSPEQPNLYVLNTSTGGDDVDQRFGMREFRFDTRTKRAYLNNKIIYLRGSNIALHRFFEDTLGGMLPWNDKWLRKLLDENPRKLGWNSMRFHIGPVPDKWLDICDEAGLLVQNEFPIWGYRSYWDKEEVKKQVTGWVTDNCNHASVVIWDICNETNSEELAEILPAVRKADMSRRPWENGYHLPDDENDPVNDHHYFMYYNDTLFFRNNPHHIWKNENFETWTGEKSTNSAHPTAHAVVMNEYGWLWLKRNGMPANSAIHQFDVLAPNATPEERIEKAAYQLAVETEYFRAHRNYAAVMHFVYLTADHAKATTSDLFRNVETLELHPAYEKYFKEAFRPLGVYLNFTRDTIHIHNDWTFAVMMVNDEYRTMQGRIEVSIINPDGTVFAKESKPFSLSELSAHTYALKVKLPQEFGNYTVKATAYPDNYTHTTTSIRRLVIAE